VLFSGTDFMRLFIALDIDEGIRELIACFAEDLQKLAPEARWVKPESLHVTLKFIGEQPEEAVAQIESVLKGMNGSAIEIHFQGYGFFPTAKAARVFWIGMSADPQLAALASSIDEKMATLGIAKENRGFNPHLTLARGSGGSGAPRWRKGDSPNRTFQCLHEKLTNLLAPEFGTMTAREFFLYRSQLSPKGSQYSKLVRFNLS
jgi:RNA 2',3'-cyclic 3'-phosphodiesterase